MKITLEVPKGWMPGCCACCNVSDDAGCRSNGKECPLQEAVVVPEPGCQKCIFRYGSWRCKEETCYPMGIKEPI